MPLGDRDYMKASSSRQTGRGMGFFSNWSIDPSITLIGINVVIWLATLVMTSSVRIETQVNMGLSPLFFSERPWTLLTSMFLHVDFWHIFSNMLALFFFGRVVYKIVGSWRFLVIYFAAGLVGNVVYLLLGPDVSIAYGASGAVYGVVGTLVVLMPNLRVALWGIIPLPLWVFALIFMGLLSVPPFAASNIAWQAHMGGVAVGLLAGVIYRRQMKYIMYR
jgi:membrane associated rhomboid family serine protease